MTSHYTNIISIACLFLCLFIASASARSSLIRQFTDGFNTSLQSSEENTASANLEEANHMLHNHQEISSRDYNVSALRKVPSFGWWLSRFSTLHEECYESVKFLRGGRRWYVRVYPNGMPIRTNSPGLAVFLVLDEDEKLSKRIYVDVNIRVQNIIFFHDVQRRLNIWIDAVGQGFGYDNLVSQADLRDPSKGFVVNDRLSIKLDFAEISETKYS